MQSSGRLHAPGAMLSRTAALLAATVSGRGAVYHSPRQEDTVTVRDEVCGMTLAPEEAAATVQLQGKTYHFCSERCRAKFEEHPDWYVSVPDNAGGPDHGNAHGHH